MGEKKSNQIEKAGNDLVVTLDKTFKQVPHLPANIREILVQIVPWLALVFGILGVIGSLAALLVVVGLSPVMALGGAAQTGVAAIILAVIGLVSSAITLMAFPKLQKKQYGGWMLLFWSQLLGIVSALLTISLGSFIGIVLGFYLLFEIKEYYK